MHEDTQVITDIILEAKDKAKRESSSEPEPALTSAVDWPINCIVGPGLEGAIACESKIGYVNGSKGWLIYRGYDIFDLCAYSNYEEVSYLLLHGNMPTTKQLEDYKRNLILCRNVSGTLRQLMSVSVEKMNPMAVLRLGINLMRSEFTYDDQSAHRQTGRKLIDTDADGIPMETKPRGEKRAVYEFSRRKPKKLKYPMSDKLESAADFNSCYRLIAGTASLVAASNRIRQDLFPLEQNPQLSHAANLIYMMTGQIPTPEEERIVDIALILHADHGMNASTFAAMVVASTLSDIYFSIGSGVAALSGPLHGGANEEVIHMLHSIGSERKVKSWLKEMIAANQKVTGFGHRVYKAYDPRARILAPLAKYLSTKNKEILPLFKTAQVLEKEVVDSLGETKKIFPNVDYYSGIVYHALNIPIDLFTPMFAVSRVAGWTARVMEYLQKNRIFRPRAIYTGSFDRPYIPIEDR